MINCNENDNDTIDHINKTYRDQDVDTETNIENKVCLGKAMSQHLRLNKLKKVLLMKKACICQNLIFMIPLIFCFYKYKSFL